MFIVPMQVTVPVLAKIGKTARFPSTTRPTPQCRIRSMAVTQVPVDTLCDFRRTKQDCTADLDVRQACAQARMSTDSRGASAVTGLQLSQYRVAADRMPSRRSSARRDGRLRSDRAERPPTPATLPSRHDRQPKELVNHPRLLMKGDIPRTCPRLRRVNRVKHRPLETSSPPGSPQVPEPSA